jgi:hypothetical protein
MGRQSLRDDLRLSLSDTATLFQDGDIDRQLDVAASDLGRVRRRTAASFITLIANVHLYPAPSNMISPTYSHWGMGNPVRQYQSWRARTFPSVLPRLSRISDDTPRLVLNPAPTVQQIAQHGSRYDFFYIAAHIIGVAAIDTTIRLEDRALLLLRAQAEAMKEVAVRNSRKPVSIRDGLGSNPKNGTPAALYRQLIDAFHEQAKPCA